MPGAPTMKQDQAGRDKTSADAPFWRAALGSQWMTGSTTALFYENGFLLGHHQ